MCSELGKHAQNEFQHSKSSRERVVMRRVTSQFSSAQFSSCAVNRPLSSYVHVPQRLRLSVLGRRLCRPRTRPPPGSRDQAAGHVTRDVTARRLDWCSPARDVAQRCGRLVIRG